MAVKRLLSIDGGGIRGVIAAAILVHIEQELRNHNPQWQRLSDFFHFIGGTSTGSILAAGLAKGMSASDLLKMYQDKGREIFTKSWSAYKPFVGDLFTKYDPYPLECELEKVFGDLTIGSPKLKTKLAIVTKNITAGKTDIFSNLPKNNLFKKDPNVKLRDIIRGSSAAPTFFPPHTFSVNGKSYEFIDGGVSMYNNPALEIFLQATEKKYGLNWSTGVDKLLLVSIGTGFYDNKVPYGDAAEFTAVQWAKYLVDGLMNDANLQQNQLLKILGFQPNQPQKSKPEGKLFTYFRFTTPFYYSVLNGRLGIDTKGINMNVIKQMDCVNEVDILEKIGQAVAKEQFHLEYFEHFLQD